MSTRFIDSLPKKLQAKVCPTEAQEQAAVCRWLEINEIVYAGVPNGTHTPGKASQGIAKATGRKKGFPDLLIFNTPTKCPKQGKPLGGCVHQGSVCPLDAKGVALEMKRMVGGVVSKEQREWLRVLETLGWISLVADGYDHAIEQLTALGYARRTTS